jgi:hypothetical protein
VLSVISSLEFSLDPPQAANAIAAVESRANVFDVVLIFLMEVNYSTRIGFARHEGKFLNNFIYLFIGQKIAISGRETPSFQEMRYEKVTFATPVRFMRLSSYGINDGRSHTWASSMTTKATLAKMTERIVLNLLIALLSFRSRIA